MSTASMAQRSHTPAWVDAIEAIVLDHPETVEPTLLETTRLIGLVFGAPAADAPVAPAGLPGPERTHAIEYYLYRAASRALASGADELPAEELRRLREVVAAFEGSGRWR